MQGSHIAVQVYFTTYEKLKAEMKKREGMPQPIQHMISAVGAGDSTCHSAVIYFCSSNPYLYSMLSQSPDWLRHTALKLQAMLL